MSNYALTRNKQVGIKIETVPGTQETLAAADYGLYCSEISAAPGPEFVKLDAFRGTLSAAAQRIGKVSGTVTLKGELKNSGTANVVPKIDPLLRACGLACKRVLTLVTGNGDALDKLVAGRTVVTGTNSGAKGLVLSRGGVNVVVAVLSGNFLLTEGTITAPGFSVALESIGPQAGWAYVPVSDPSSMQCVSAEVREGGALYGIYGAMGTLSFELSADSYPTWSATLTGIASKGDWGTAADEMTGVTYDDRMPAVVNSANLSIDLTNSPITAAVSVDVGNGVTLIKDLNSSTWYRRAVVTSREASAAMTIHALDPAQYGAYTQLFSGALANIQFGMGYGAGDAIKVFLPAAQFTGITNGDADGFVTNEIKLSLTGIADGDNEVCLWFI